MLYAPGQLVFGHVPTPKFVIGQLGKHPQLGWKVELSTMGKQSKRKDGKDRKQKLEERRQRQIEETVVGEPIKTGDRVRYWDGDLGSWVRGIVRNKGKVKDMRSSETDERHPRHDECINKTVYNVAPIGAAPDDETNVKTVMDTGKNIFPVKGETTL